MPPMLVFFLHVFVFWLFASFSRTLKFQCLFFFILYLLFGHLQVFQEHRTFSAHFLSSYVWCLVICMLFKSVEPPMLVFFFLVFTF
jgi:hypothetical protein